MNIKKAHDDRVVEVRKRVDESLNKLLLMCVRILIWWLTSSKNLRPNTFIRHKEHDPLKVAWDGDLVDNLGTTPQSKEV